MLIRAGVAEYRCRRTGIGLTDREWAFYRVFGLLRLAGSCQQMYHRARIGHFRSGYPISCAGTG